MPKASLPRPWPRFARDYNEPLIHQVVTAYQANARQGTRAQKRRSEIAKSTRKPWRQTRPGTRRHGLQPPAARRRQDIPVELGPRRN